MNIKTISLSLVLVLATALLTAAATVYGTHLLSGDKEKAGKSSSLFKSTKEQPVAFFELKNVVLTMKNSGRQEHYLLLELALVTHENAKIKRIEEMSPAIRGATVSLFSELEYSDARALSVNELRERLMAAYTARFKTLGIEMPFNDVIISKMIFQ
ncbi:MULTISPECIES: flagellar basal body-associated protein FliL [unclassified Serratia (in: enterobacteria)]|uniref:flagellar basal body-associated FliL family protein n=1 Tax=unclassified Serratia (in: enterobacteria) TaxID=2647522 RepID=UPI000505D130|nr:MULTISPECIES: flagellar basal body-associated FliL family protein [unclassified Serratia (in: enterobacteria)]KFK95333.1 flagellar biogenesis protein [Serratia sp. Ag2]KFK98681.1 flagellar biogenesis protein [Serratia sp. Ag1]